LIFGLSTILLLTVFLLHWDSRSQNFSSWMFEEPTLADDWVNNEFKAEWWELYAHGISNNGKYRILMRTELYKGAKSSRLWITVTNLETQEEYFFHEDSVGNGSHMHLLH
jgi:hypothetical protein